jgi:FolB domain-containing protein
MDHPVADQITLKRVEFQTHIGVSTEERKALQPIEVDLELDYPPTTLGRAADTDDIAQIVDYTAVVGRVIQTGTERDYCLLETLAERLSEMLLKEFAVESVRLWVRKPAHALNGVRGSVGIRMERRRADQSVELKPSRFLIDNWRALPVGKALDVAAGRGRHTLYLATRGFSIEAIDRDMQVLAELSAAAQGRQLTNVRVRAIDLEDSSHNPLPQEAYDAILVFFYLYRPLFPSLLRALRPGGVLMYETFLIDNHVRYQHPRRREFCLAHNELLHLTSELRVLYYDEGPHEDSEHARPSFTARLLGQKVG